MMMMMMMTMMMMMFQNQISNDSGLLQVRSDTDRPVRMALSGMLWVCALLGVSMAAYDPSQDYTQCCVCSDLMPINPAPGSHPQVMPSPFQIKVSSETYRLDQEVIGMSDVLSLP